MRTVTLGGAHGRIETVELEGFATTPLRSTLRWAPNESLYVVGPPGPPGFGWLTVSPDSAGTVWLAEWQRDHGRYMTRAWPEQHHAVHPMRVVARWPLTRCAAP
jgi:hypothetical protein